MCVRERGVHVRDMCGSGIRIQLPSELGYHKIIHEYKSIVNFTV